MGHLLARARWYFSLRIMTRFDRCTKLPGRGTMPATTTHTHTHTDSREHAYRRVPFPILPCRLTKGLDCLRKHVAQLAVAADNIVSQMIRPRVDLRTVSHLQVQHTGGSAKHQWISWLLVTCRCNTGGAVSAQHLLAVRHLQVQHRWSCLSQTSPGCSSLAGAAQHRWSCLSQTSDLATELFGRQPSFHITTDMTHETSYHRGHLITVIIRSVCASDPLVHRITMAIISQRLRYNEGCRISLDLIRYVILDVACPQIFRSKGCQISFDLIG